MLKKNRYKSTKNALEELLWGSRRWCAKAEDGVSCGVEGSRRIMKGVCKGSTKFDQAPKV